VTGQIGEPCERDWIETANILCITS
jgi:hypothetical protein